MEYVEFQLVCTLYIKFIKDVVGSRCQSIIEAKIHTRRSASVPGRTTEKMFRAHSVDIWTPSSLEPLRFLCKRHYCCTHFKAIHSKKLQIRYVNIPLRTSNNSFMISCLNSDNYRYYTPSFEESAIVYEVSCRFASVIKTH